MPTDGTPAPPRAERTPRDPAREERRLRWITRAGYHAIRLLARTWRIRVVGREPVDALRARRAPLAFAFWHGQMLPLLYQHRGEGVAILISAHRDGEVIARIGHRFGFRSVRGSSSRGAARALLGLVRELEGGGEVAVTPDGPRGPAERFAPGTLIAAQRAGAYIVPVAAVASRAWRLRSWDQFQIPKPFARVTVAYATPTQVQAGTARDAEGEAGRFEALLGEAAALARGNLGS
ncbi:MAG TPA: lysophospholipid acyltransferase family protein [Gemmatimonadaceae bacterium]|nr:lysophospholipid acyltransferase family protein [Gemmatimonadaceae bacterium]